MYVSVFVSILLCEKKIVVMVKVIKFVQRCLQVSCAFLACNCLNADNWKSEGQAGLNISSAICICSVSFADSEYHRVIQISLFFLLRIFWHRLHCFFWHTKTKYLILIALSANTFLKTQETSSARVNKCISSLLIDHSAIHRAVAFLNSLLSSASFQLAMERVTTAWWKIPSIWILSLSCLLEIIQINNWFLAAHLVPRIRNTNCWK